MQGGINTEVLSAWMVSNFSPDLSFQVDVLEDLLCSAAS